jgi:hypothetical protein
MHFRFINSAFKNDFRPNRQKMASIRPKYYFCRRFRGWALDNQFPQGWAKLNFAVLAIGDNFTGIQSVKNPGTK